MNNYRVNAENVLAERNHENCKWGYRPLEDKVATYNKKFMSGLDRYVRKENN